MPYLANQLTMSAGGYNYDRIRRQDRVINALFLAEKHDICGEPTSYKVFFHVRSEHPMAALHVAHALLEFTYESIMGYIIPHPNFHPKELPAMQHLATVLCQCGAVGAATYSANFGSYCENEMEERQAADGRMFRVKTWGGNVHAVATPQRMSRCYEQASELLGMK